MDDETLIQRFLDGELGRAERRALLLALESRRDLRDRLMADEAMLETAASLPRPEVPGGFMARVVGALPPGEARPLAARRAELAPFRLVAAACLLVAGGYWAGRAASPVSVPAADAAAPREVHVRLVLLEPGARAVAVVGDFNGWDPRRTPLQRSEGGVFHVTLPLKPGRYHYMYVIDGKEWVADPFAAETSLDGFGAQNSVLDVET